MRPLSLLITLVYLVNCALPQCLSPEDTYLDGACFVFVNERMPFWNASCHCNRNLKSAWGELAKVDNALKARFLSRLGTSIFSMTHGQFWVGTYRTTSSDPFRYMDSFFCRYNNFADVNPSMNFAAQSVANGMWYTYPSETKLPFVCYYQPPSSTNNEEDWLKKSVRRNVQC